MATQRSSRGDLLTDTVASVLPLAPYAAGGLAILALLPVAAGLAVGCLLRRPFRKWVLLACGVTALYALWDLTVRSPADVGRLAVGHARFSWDATLALLVVLWQGRGADATELLRAHFLATWVLWPLWFPFGVLLGAAFRPVWAFTRASSRPKTPSLPTRSGANPDADPLKGEDPDGLLTGMGDGLGALCPPPPVVSLRDRLLRRVPGVRLAMVCARRGRGLLADRGLLHVDGPEITGARAGGLVVGRVLGGLLVRRPGPGAGAPVLVPGGGVDGRVAAGAAPAGVSAAGGGGGLRRGAAGGPQDEAVEVRTPSHIEGGGFGGLGPTSLDQMFHNGGVGGSPSPQEVCRRVYPLVAGATPYPGVPTLGPSATPQPQEGPRGLLSGWDTPPTPLDPPKRVFPRLLGMKRGRKGIEEGGYLSDLLPDGPEEARNGARTGPNPPPKHRISLCTLYKQPPEADGNGATGPTGTGGQGHPTATPLGDTPTPVLVRARATDTPTLIPHAGCLWGGTGQVGTVELWGAPPKTGKTRLLSDLTRAQVRGGTFMGWPTRESGVVWLVEETAALFRPKQRRADPTGAMMRVRYGPSTPNKSVRSLPRHLVEAVALCALLERRTGRPWREVRVDSLFHWCPEAETDAGAAKAALGALKATAALGYLVRVVVHSDYETGRPKGPMQIWAQADFRAQIETVPKKAEPEATDRRRVVWAGRFEDRERPAPLAYRMVAGELQREGQPAAKAAPPATQSLPSAQVTEALAPRLLAVAATGESEADREPDSRTDSPPPGDKRAARVSAVLDLLPADPAGPPVPTKALLAALVPGAMTRTELYATLEAMRESDPPPVAWTKGPQREGGALSYRRAA